ncbi:MAG: Transketolase central region [Conexibacter sp.]|nr:Transketolase central region [Conexibacter sp.]
MAQESPPNGSWGASPINRVVQEHVEWLDAPPTLVAAEETPVPYARELEAAWMPSVERSVQTVTRVSAY